MNLKGGRRLCCAHPSTATHRSLRGVPQVDALFDRSPDGRAECTGDVVGDVDEADDADGDVISSSSVTEAEAAVELEAEESAGSRQGRGGRGRGRRGRKRGGRPATLESPPSAAAALPLQQLQPLQPSPQSATSTTTMATKAGNASTDLLLEDLLSNRYRATGACNEARSSLVGPPTPTKARICYVEGLGDMCLFWWIRM